MLLQLQRPNCVCTNTQPNTLRKATTRHSKQKISFLFFKSSFLEFICSSKIIHILLFAMRGYYHANSITIRNLSARRINSCLTTALGCEVNKVGTCIVKCLFGSRNFMLGFYLL